MQRGSARQAAWQLAGSAGMSVARYNEPRSAIPFIISPSLIPGGNAAGVGELAGAGTADGCCIGVAAASGGAGAAACCGTEAGAVAC